jgi:ribonuclease HI
MDRHATTAATDPSRVLDSVFRRLSNENGAGLLFVSPLGEHMRYVVRLHFPASNNMAEYEALLCGIKIAIEIGVKRLDVRGIRSS